jgi:S-formylglutathione hydrolase
MSRAALKKSHKTFAGLTQFWQHDAASTGTPMQFSTFIPGAAPRGCLIWLSGLTCTPENFIVKAGAQKFLAEHELMALCPDTSPRDLQLPHEHDDYDFGAGASFYVDATTPGYADHYRMDRYVTAELHQLIQSQFAIPPGRISIMGHSMGGHGALVLGLRAPDNFRSVSAFSPIAHPTAAPWGQKAFTGYLGPERQKWAAYDATELVASGKRHPHEILIDQGTADEFLETQLHPADFNRACSKASQPVTINLREGYDHSYYFISTFIQSHIAFHAAAMR